MARPSLFDQWSARYLRVVSDLFSVITQLQQIVGAKHVLVRPTELLVYGSDGLPGYHKRPSLAVLPGTRDEVVAVVRALHAAGLAFVARGAGTGLSGGALADGVVLLGLNRLRTIIAVDPEARTALVEPGVVNANLLPGVLLQRGQRIRVREDVEAAALHRIDNHLGDLRRLDARRHEVLQPRHSAIVYACRAAVGRHVIAAGDERARVVHEVGVHERRAEH